MRVHGVERDSDKGFQVIVFTELIFAEVKVGRVYERTTAVALVADPVQRIVARGQMVEVTSRCLRRRLTPPST
jgi:hypothetical protein